MSADPAGWELVNPNRGGYSVIEATNWYSYVSNNPVKYYVDPTGKVSWVVQNGKCIDRRGYEKKPSGSNNPPSGGGSWGGGRTSRTSHRRRMNPKEATFVHEVLGNQGFLAMRTVRIRRASGGRASAMPWGTISSRSVDYNNPMGSNYGRNSLIHEAFHQVQYSSKNGAFLKLVEEQILKIFGKDVYASGNYKITSIAQYSDLDSMSYLEAQAQMVGDFGELYYTAKYTTTPLSQIKKDALQEMSRIMKASGYESEATRWVDANFS